jgi:hypothetical protein
MIEHNVYEIKAGKFKQSVYRHIAVPECSMRLRLPDFKTLGTQVGKVVIPTH